MSQFDSGYMGPLLHTTPLVSYTQVSRFLSIPTVNFQLKQNPTKKNNQRKSVLFLLQFAGLLTETEIGVVVTGERGNQSLNDFLQIILDEKCSRNIPQ